MKLFDDTLNRCFPHCCDHPATQQHAAAAAQPGEQSLSAEGQQVTVLSHVDCVGRAMGVILLSTHNTPFLRCARFNDGAM